MTVWILTVAAALCAMLHIRADYRGEWSLTYLFKPLTMLAVIAIAVQMPAPVSALYRSAVIAGLVFSLGGDVFLMLPKEPRDRFIFGLASFLVAHLCYIAAFASGLQIGMTWTLLPYLLYGGVLYVLLGPHLGKMRWPGIAYMLTILAMSWLALERWMQTEETASLVAFVGTLFFVVSDTVLATNRFVRRFAAGQLLTLGSYYPAQWLIALSIGGLSWM